MTKMPPHVFVAGEEIKRRELHSRFGGNQQGGMSPCPKAGVILLFTSPHGDLYGYEDRFQADGMFWYTGEGQVGEMKFVRANRALRDHETEGHRVLLFEQTRKGYVRFVTEVRYAGHHMEFRLDRNRQQRLAIVFHLEALETRGMPESTARSIDEVEVLKPSSLAHMSLDELRLRALSSASSSSDTRHRIVAVQNRAEAIRQYALKRASGVCESCCQPAPFHSKKGPYLEVHHLHRLSDGGPDHPDSVAAICPNCHREIHAGIDGSIKNDRLVQSVRRRESSVASFR
jgi:5-methylcytosine-specific restriction protein A